MAQLGRLYVRTTPVELDLGYLATRRDGRGGMLCRLFRRDRRRPSVYLEIGRAVVVPEVLLDSPKSFEPAPDGYVIHETHGNEVPDKLALGMWP